ncbi:TPA: sugar phosphate isomerase/epimerase family protein [Enterococcus faecium]
MPNINQLYGMNIHYRYYDLEYFFKSCSIHGIDNVEIWLCPQHFYINSFFTESSDKLINLMEKYNIKIKCLCPEQNNPKPNNIAARGQKLIEYSQSYFEKVIDLASIVESKLVLITPGWNYYDETPEEARSRSVRMLRELCEYAETKGVTLALESIWNKSSLIGDTISKINEIKERVNMNNLKLAIDLGAINSAGESVNEWFDSFGEDIVHCHFVDGTPVGHMPWGLGNLDMKEILQTFSKNGYEGGFSMEYVDSRSFINPGKWDSNTKELFLKNIQD